MAVRNFPFRYKIYTKKEIDELLSEIDLTDYYTKSEIDTKLAEKQNVLTAGDNVAISEENVISATDTKYTAGTGITISADNEISASGSSYTAGDGIDITNDVISLKGWELVNNSDVPNLFHVDDSYRIVSDNDIVFLIEDTNSSLQGTGVCLYIPKGLVSATAGQYSYPSFQSGLIQKHYYGTLDNKMYFYYIEIGKTSNSAGIRVDVKESFYSFTIDGTDIKVSYSMGQTKNLNNIGCKVYKRIN